MKKLVLISLTIFSTFWATNAQNLQDFNLNNIKIGESPFLNAQQTDYNYIMSLEIDRLLAPFLIDAGFEAKGKRYPNWENTGLDGHIGGHYLTALSNIFAATGDSVVLDSLMYMIDWLKKCQDKNGNGYVGGIPNSKTMWDQIANGNISASGFDLNGSWVPLYNIHKLYAGLRDAYLVAEVEVARQMLIDLTDWMIETTKNLTDSQIQEMLKSEHGGLNEVFADVAEITGESKYLELAKQFSHQQILNPLLEKKNRLTHLHANTQIPKIIGFKRVADVGDDNAWNDASRYFWELITNKWTVSIGGNSVAEHFHPSSDFSSMLDSEQGPETCNTYNMLKLTKALFLSDPKVEYIDYYERALYNHILSSQHPDKGGFVYFTPVRPNHYKVYSQPQESFWCCVGSGMENHGKYGDLIYAHNDTDLYVNLFIPSAIEWKDKGVSIQQKTTFPNSNKVTLKISCKENPEFRLKIRYPSWVHQDSIKVFINGIEDNSPKTQGTYFTIDRSWQNIDSVNLTLPMHTVAEQMPDGSPWYSFIHGPIVLAYQSNLQNLTGLFADDGRFAHIASGTKYHHSTSPKLLAQANEISNNVILNTPDQLSFQYTGQVALSKHQNFELKPFYTIHEARYSMYFKVEKPVSTNLVNNTKNSMLDSWPNPVVSQLNIKFQIDKAQNVQLSLVDIYGSKFNLIEEKYLMPGEYQDIIDTKGYKNGIYLLQLKTDNTVEVRKFIINL